FSVATNVYRSELRKFPVMVPLDSVAEPAVSEGTDARIAEDNRRVVRQMVQSLPPKYRDTLVLFYFHGSNVAAAARSLGLPEGTVKARLARGRDMLRSKLARML